MMLFVPVPYREVRTSTNMNVNEVIANLALTVLGQAPGNYDTIHPLDDVNRGQSFRKFRTTP